MHNITPQIYRICIIILSFEWIVFGSMHFSAPVATNLQIPEYIKPDGIRKFVSVASGMVEVCIGILILVPQARRWAALASLLVLVAFIPAVYHILANDMTGLESGFLATLFKVLLIPNNIFLGLCSIHLWRNQPPEAAKHAQIIENTLTTPRRWNPGNATLLVAVLLLLSNCAGFLAILGAGLSNIAVANLWALMCVAIGALIGFLFAVPRVNDAYRSDSALLTNTNIETVSDWLTKILVGVGLINLTEIDDFIADQSKKLGELIRPPVEINSASFDSFATALILYFFVVGVIQGYLLTRMFLSGQFVQQVENLAGDAETAGENR